MSPSNAAVLGALEAFWARARALHPDLPEAVFLLPTNEGSRRVANGSFAASRWKPKGYDGEAYYCEVAIFAERLRDGAALVADTALHEAAHALAHVRGLKDTTRGGHYHNKVFRTLAEEVGLVCEHADGKAGYGLTGLKGPETLQPYAQEVQALHEAIQAHRDIPEPEERPAKEKEPGTKKVKLSCPDHPDNNVWIRQRDLDDAIDALTCWACGNALEAPEDEEEKEPT